MAARFQSQKHPDYKPLTQERLKELLTYDPKTGEFASLVRQGSRAAGKRVGAISHGYLLIRIDYILYRAHRLAWLYVTGEWPQDQIDHIDMNRMNNRFSNLREATNTENRRNLTRRSTNTSGYKGVTFDRERGLWAAHIGVEYRCVNLGRFKTKEEAYKAYCRGAKKYFGEFGRVK